MKGIKDIIVKGSIFAVLTAVFCMGGAGRGIETVRAEVDNTTLEYFRPSVDNDGKVTPTAKQVGLDTITETIKFAGKDWYVIGYDGTGVSSRTGIITLLYKDYMGGGTQFGPDNSYAGSNVAGYLADQYDAFTNNAKAAIVPRSLTSGTDEIAGGDITAGLWALSKSEAKKLPQSVLKLTSASWWLRTADSEHVYTVDMSGVIGTAHGNNSFRIRPALWVRADSVIYKAEVTNPGAFILNYKYTLTPKPIAVGDSLYDTIQEAMDAAENGDTVKLLRNVKTDSPLTVSKTLTLDLNGHTIDRGLSGNGNSYGSVISIKSSGNLTLSDNSIDQTGLITGGNTQGAGSGVRVESGIFTMNGGTIIHN